MDARDKYFLVPVRGSLTVHKYIDTSLLITICRIWPSISEQTSYNGRWPSISHSRDTIRSSGSTRYDSKDENLVCTMKWLVNDCLLMWSSQSMELYEKRMSDVEGKIGATKKKMTDLNAGDMALLSIQLASGLTLGMRWCVGGNRW